MKTLKVGLLAGVALFGMVGVSQALTVSGGSISYTGATDYETQLGNLSRFNSAAGTLTAVTFTAGYGFNSTITVTATTASTGNVSTESAAAFETSDAAIQAILNRVINTATPAVIGSTELNPTAYDYVGTRRIYNLAAGSSSQYQSNFATTSTTYNVAPADFEAFMSTASGSPTFDVYGKTLTGLNLTSTGGNATASQVTTAMQNISILYTYTAAEVAPPTTVPEPASLALLGAGLLGLGMIRRKSA